MRFSQRIGKMPLKVKIQKESMDSDLRIGLWNAFQLSYLKRNANNNFIKLSKVFERSKT